MSIRTMFTVTGCLLLITFFGYSKSESNRRCLPLYDGNSYCFTQPDPPVALSWYEAQLWCKNINATLPIPDTSYHSGVYANALGYFGLQTDTLWLSANATHDPNNWLWMDGSRFTGTVENSYSPGKTHAYVIRNGTDLKFVAASPSEGNSHICQETKSEISCASSPSTLWANGRCFGKYSDRRSWYSFFSTCTLKYIASYDDLKDFSRWLDTSKKFWMGLRSGWWSWMDLVTGKSIEIIESRETSTLPDASVGQCLAASKGPSKWINMDCGKSLQFICQQRVAKSTSHGSYLAESYSDSYNRRTVNNRVVPSHQPTSNGSYLPQGYSDFYRPKHTVNYPLIIGLGVGLGGLFLIVTVCAILVICARRRKHDSGYSGVCCRKLCEHCRPRTTSSNFCNNYAFKAASGTVERHGTQYKYKPLNPAANSYVY